MGAYDTFAAARVPCPSCGDLYWESCQIKFFDPYYDTQRYLHPGEGRALDFDPGPITTAEVWESEWVRLAEQTRAGELTLLLHEWELRTCTCGAVLVPVARVSYASTGPESGTMSLDALELWDLRDPTAVGRLDFADPDWFRIGDARTGVYRKAEELGALPRHARRELFAEALARRRADASAGHATNEDHGGWTWIEGPARCEACGRTRMMTQHLFITHPQEGRFFGDAWLGGELTPGSRIGPVPDVAVGERLRGRYYRLREPVPSELTFLDARAAYGCACGAGRASTRIRFERDGAHLVFAGMTWRVVRGAADLADIDWIETGSRRYLAREDITDEDRLRGILAERQISG